jgi:hypothetical protein
VRPALRKYQEAGQLAGKWLRLWGEMVFGEKLRGSDSKTGSAFCTKITQNANSAYLLGAKEAKF